MSLEMTKNLNNTFLSMLSGFLDSNFCIRICFGDNTKHCKYPTHLLLLHISGLFEGELGQILLSSVIYMYIYQTKM